MDTVLGKALFERLWVSAPSSTKAADGLGPLFNARACSSCHQGGGRAEVSLQEGDLPASAGLTLRVGAAEGRRAGAAPAAGQPGADLRRSRSQAGEQAARHLRELIRRRWATARRSNCAGRASAIDGQETLADLAWISPRLAPDLHGGGLLERVPLTWLAAQADPDDLDGDGISGSVVMGQYGEAGHRARPLRLEGRRARPRSPDLRRVPFRSRPLDAGAARAVGRLHRPRRRIAAPRRRAPTSAASRSRPPSCRWSRPICASLPAPASSAATDETQTRPRCSPRSAAAPATHRQQPAELADGATMWFAPYTDLLIHDMGDGLADRAFDDSISDRRRRARMAHRPLVGPGRSCRSEGRRQPAA